MPVKTIRRGRIRSMIGALLATVVVAAGLTAFSVPQQAEAANAADFDPGYIISDENFFAPNAMSVADIQNFLNARVPNCQAGFTCLKSFRETTRTIPGTPMCSTYQGAANESSATIIWKVAQACGISPAVLLVTLQKEQALVTSTAPSSRAYRSAMGAGCPDTAACDANYYGFFNQMHYGAYLMKRYTHPAGTGPGTSYNTRFDLMYPVGRTTNVLFHPNAACGSAPVHIRNQATHVLYVYTPYQPNAASLANMYGTGDGCSSYGNRNFFRIYTDWFGPTTAPPHPFGDLNAVTGTPGQIAWNGWAIDPDTADPIRVDIYVNGKYYRTSVANGARPDVGAAYPDAGPNHGYAGSMRAATGTHQVCAYGINVGRGANALLGCRTVVVPDASPIGSINGIAASGGSIDVRGWAFDPESTAPIKVDAWINGRWARTLTANQSRPDVKAAYPAQGANHGFAASLAGSTGTNQVCLHAINIGTGSNKALGCRTVTIGANAPRGDINGVTAGAAQVSVRGWAFDADTVNPIKVDVWVNGAWARTLVANGARPDVKASFPAQGANHGFSGTAPAKPGSNSVCIYGIGVGGGPASTLLGCRTVSVAAAAAPVVPPVTAPPAPVPPATTPAPVPPATTDVLPRGDINAVTVANGQANVRGWAFDADTTDPIKVDVWVNGAWARTLVANVARPDVQAAFPLQGPAHGFAGVVPLRAGSNQVCFYGINVGGSVNPLLGCRSVGA